MIRCALLRLAAVLSVLAALAPAAAAQQPTAGQPQVIDGPSADIVRPAGLGFSISRDGAGGLVYLKDVAGVQHVFVSVFDGGVFQPPVQVDRGLGASSQPVIAAGDGGLLLVAFISGGELYVAGRTTDAVPLGPPVALAAGASNPAISITLFGKAYLAFTAADGGGDDVRVAYYNKGAWAVVPSVLSVSATDSPGTGTGRPAVAAAGDGVGIVAWGEAGHVFSRRVWGTLASVATEQADAALPGCSELAADQPAVGTEGNSSFADVVFHEVVSCGGGQQSRVLMNRLQASRYLGVTQPDGLTGVTSDGAGDPQITMGEYGHGWITSERTNANDLIASLLGDDGAIWGTIKVNSASDLTAPDGVPATAGLRSNLIAWQQNPGASGEPEIRVRFAPDNGSLGPEAVASSPAQGPTDADNGLAAAGDVGGDAAVAWVQGAPGATQIVVDLLYQPPPPFGLAGGPRPYVARPQPQLRWSQSGDAWGPITYTVTVDSSQVAQTRATSLVVPSPVADGPHSWFVTATNPAGETATTRTATLFVDTVAPAAQLAFSGTKLIGRPVNTFLTYTDPPPPGEPVTDASGVASAVVHWGDGTSSRLHLRWHRSFHTYSRPGTYAITAVVTDRAGNVGRAALRVRILKPKPKKKRSPSRPRHGRRA